MSQEMNDYEFQEMINDIVASYRGDGVILSNALGVLVLGRLMGWRVVYLMHSEATMRKYQAALGVQFKEILPEKTAISRRSLAFDIVEKLGNFWRVVQGRDKSITREQRVFLESS